MSICGGKPESPGKGGEHKKIADGVPAHGTCGDNWRLQFMFYGVCRCRSDIYMVVRSACSRSSYILECCNISGRMTSKIDLRNRMVETS